MPTRWSSQGQTSPLPVVEIMELHDGGAEANALRCIHGDNGSRLVALAREAALRGYHRAWGF